MGIRAKVTVACASLLLLVPLMPYEVQARGFGGRGGLRGGFGRGPGFGRGFGRGFGYRGYWWGGRMDYPGAGDEEKRQKELWYDPYPQFTKDNNGYWGGWGGVSGHRNETGWSGWARPDHRFRSYGWGGWTEPFYASGGAYSYSDFDNQSADAQGNFYQSATYNLNPEAISSLNLKSVEPDQASGKISFQSRFRLGPDTDIMDGGNIAFRLTKDSFLLITSGKLLVVDQKSGFPAMALYPDKVLYWQLAQEIDQQSLGLQASLKRKGSLINSPAIKDSKEKTIQLNKELDNIDKTIGLLKEAREKLTNVGDKAPEKDKPPEPGAIEIFASTWVSKSGDYVVAREHDGTYIYIDGKSVYKDKNKTKINREYPGIFCSVISGYLTKLLSEAPDTTKNLEKDSEITSWAIEQIKKGLEKADDKSSKEATSNESSDKEVDDPLIPEKKKAHLQQALMRTEHRYAAISNQLKDMPEEISAFKKLVALLKK